MSIAVGALAEEPLLSAAQEYDLALQMEAGVLAREQQLRSGGRLDASAEELELLVQRGEHARQRYIKANLRLVAMVSRPAATRSGLSQSDLFQEGCLGLIQAVERFDCRRGHRFSTYALFWIRAFVSAASANRLGTLNLPASRAEKLRSVRGVESELSQLLGRAATVAELADQLQRPHAWVADLLSHQAPQTLDDCELPAPDQVAENVVDRRSRAELGPLAAWLLAALPDLERDVLVARMGFGERSYSYVETAALLDVSVSRVRRLEARALERLRGRCPQSAAAHL